MTITLAPTQNRLLKDLTDADLAEFKQLCERQTDRAQYPLCVDVVDKVILYSADSLLPRLRASEEERYSVMDEIQRALKDGPGVIVMRGMIPTDVIDNASAAMDAINPKPAQSESKMSRRTFAYSEKHAKQDPESFAAYYSSEVL